MTLQKAQQILGVRLFSRRVKAKRWLMNEALRQIIIARRAGDDGRAAELSEVKAFLKPYARYNYCKECGVPISPGRSNREFKSEHCRIHRHLSGAGSCPKLLGVA